MTIGGVAGWFVEIHKLIEEAFDFVLLIPIFPLNNSQCFFSSKDFYELAVTASVMHQVDEFKWFSPKPKTIPKLYFRT